MYKLKPMTYISELSKLTLSNVTSNGIKVIDLFAGCGGLALGFESLGFETIGFECDKDAVSTYNKNLSGYCEDVFLTKKTKYPKATVLIGGPPCQPFSVGGKQLGQDDKRNGFPAYFSAVDQLLPEICIIENVRGMLYKNKRYLIEISKHMGSLGYITDFKLVKCVEHGIPQNRERLIIVCHKGNFSYPNKKDIKYTAGDALFDIAYNTNENTKFLTPNQDLYIAKYEKASKCINPRDLFLDKPSRTVTCRNLAGATGDMLRIKLPDGRRKRLSIQEAARLQSFPDWFEFSGTETSAFNQIGNAVPPLLGRELARSVLSYLNGETISNEDSQLKMFA